MGVTETVKEREKNLSRFCDDADCNVCLIATGVAATGLPLTVAHVCYFLEATPNAAEISQPTLVSGHQSLLHLMLVYFSSFCYCTL